MKILKTFVREFSGDTETPITFCLNQEARVKQITHLWVNTLWLF